MLPGSLQGLRATVRQAQSGGRALPSVGAAFSTPLFSLVQVAAFSKFLSKSRTKRLPLTTKRAGKGFYKGTGSRKEGHITRKGRFILDPRRVTELVVPDFTNCNLKAYVGPGAKRNIRLSQVDTSS